MNPNLDCDDRFDELSRIDYESWLDEIHARAELEREDEDDNGQD